MSIFFISSWICFCCVIYFTSPKSGILDTLYGFGEASLGEGLFVWWSFLKCHFTSRCIDVVLSLRIVAVNNVDACVMYLKTLLKDVCFCVAGAVPMMASGGIPMQPMHPPPPAGPRPPPLPPGRPPGEGGGNNKPLEDALKFLPPSLGSFLTRLPRAVSGKARSLSSTYESFFLGLLDCLFADFPSSSNLGSSNWPDLKQ